MKRHRYRRASDVNWGSSDILTASSLPESEKENLCRNLLAEFGVTHIRPGGDGELIHGCILPFSNHRDQDRNPTASLNYKKLTYNPVAGDTLVKTYDGERPIRELAGGTHLLLDGEGKWVESEVISSGVQRLYKVTLRRNGRVKEIYATAEHRWMIREPGQYERGKTKGLVERTTATLHPRDRIPSIWSHQRGGRLTVSPFGVARGFVFGDGTVGENGAWANFMGEKDRALLPYFEGLPVGEIEAGSQVRVGLPRSWKTELPALDEGPSYLYGWLAGLFAADGCVGEDGHMTLSSAKRDVLDHVVAICDRIGVATWGITESMRKGDGNEESSLFTLTFRRRTLTADFFILPSHRQRFIEAQSRRSSEQTHWWVVSVEPTDRVEEVFCALVPTTHSFVLEGNILTGNCLGSCQSGGSLLWFVGLMRGTSDEQARRWLSEQTGLDDEQTLSSLLEYFDEVYAGKRQEESPMPRMDPKVLEPWLVIHPYLTEIRRIPEDNIVRLKVGYGVIKIRVGPNEFIDSHRIVIPHFWKGTLVGWQTRRLTKDGTPKYHNSPDLPRDRTIYNYDAKAETAVIVESPMSVLSKCHLGPHIEATFGAKVHDKQLRYLAMHKRVTLFMDNDEAGWKATARLGEYLQDYCPVFVADNPYAADPADMDEDTYMGILNDSIPYALWEPPRELEAWESEM